MYLVKARERFDNQLCKCQIAFNVHGAPCISIIIKAALPLILLILNLLYDVIVRNVNIKGIMTVGDKQSGSIVVFILSCLTHSISLLQQVVWLSLQLRPFHLHSTELQKNFLSLINLMKGPVGLWALSKCRQNYS